VNALYALSLFALLAPLLLAQNDRFDPAALRAGSVEILRDGHLAGSGFFADTNGTVVTAAHVLGGPGHAFEIRTFGGKRVPAVPPRAEPPI